MARTINEIYNNMMDKRLYTPVLNDLQPSIDNAQTVLDDLSSNSKVAIWRMILFIAAVGIWTNEKLFDQHKDWINKRAEELIVGTLSWYRSIALQFQFGDNLIFDPNDNVYKYALINPTNKIIKLVSVSEVGGQVLMKVAKLNSSSLPIPLTLPELATFQSYIQKVKFAGVKVAVVSREADLLTVSYKVYYDPLVLTSTGESILIPGVYPVEDIINNYIQNLDFDGVFSSTQLTDKIQLSIGVVNPVFESAQAKSGINPYVVVNDYYRSNAGYLSIDPAIPLNTTITYLPYVN